MVLHTGLPLLRVPFCSAWAGPRRAAGWGNTRSCVKGPVRKKQLARLWKRGQRKSCFGSSAFIWSLSVSLIFSEIKLHTFSFFFPLTFLKNRREKKQCIYYSVCVYLSKC